MTVSRGSIDIPRTASLEPSVFATDNASIPDEFWYTLLTLKIAEGFAFESLIIVQMREECMRTIDLGTQLTFQGLGSPFQVGGNVRWRRILLGTALKGN